jgi:hypothetical protein
MEGWDFFEKKLAPPKPDPEVLEIGKFFLTDLGQMTLRHLKRMTVEKSTVPAQANDGVQMAMLMALREGENNVIRKIESYVKKAQEN